MLLLSFIRAFAITDEITLRNNTAMISFDEGPSKNINTLLRVATVNRIPIVLHLDPTLDCFTGELVKRIICSGFEVGMAITEKLDEDENNIKQVLEKFTKAFETKTNLKPVLLRLPTVGIISKLAFEIAEGMGYVVTTPNLDSEDDEKTNIWPFIVPATQRFCGTPMSVVFRDRYLRSINLLPAINRVIYKRGYRIVPASTFLGICTNLKPVLNQNYNLSMSVNPSSNTIEVTASKDDFKKETLIPLNTENKLRVRDFVKRKISSEEELNSGFEKLKEGSEKLKEGKDLSEEKVRTANQNGTDGALVLRVVVLNLLMQTLL